MKVALTGATGFVGSHVLRELKEHGHEVTALVRDRAQADKLAPGVQPAVVDLYDRPAVVGLLRQADAAIHTASPNDETSAALDSAVVDAAIEAFDGTGKPYISISGIWVYGANTAISEQSPFNAPAMVAWKERNERRVFDAKGLRGVVVVSSVAYGDGGGAIPGLLLGSPRDDAGNLIMLGTGQQHWSNVHVADLAEVFRRVLEDDTARGYYVVGNGLNPTVAELTGAAAVAAGAPGAVPGSEDEARKRLGDYFAEVLLLDQSTDCRQGPRRARLAADPSVTHRRVSPGQLPREGNRRLNRRNRGPGGQQPRLPVQRTCQPRRALGGGGAFNLCTFWLVQALTRAGSVERPRLDESTLMFESMLGYANHLGLFAEETSMTGEALGNFPHGLTHLALISAAVNLDRALGGQQQAP